MLIEFPGGEFHAGSTTSGCYFAEPRDRGMLATGVCLFVS